jgi:hypothetical protein
MCQTIAEPGIAHSPRCIHDTALILAYLSYRAMVDQEPRAEKNAQAIPRLIRTQDINGLEPSEIRFLNAPFGTLSTFDRNQASWLVEGLTVLAWALRKAKLPSYSTKGDGAKASLALGMFGPAELDKATAEDLRDFQEIEMGAATYEAVFGRIMKHLKNPEKMDLTNLLKDPATGHLLVDGLELTDGDLSIDGLPLPAVRPERLQEVLGIVRERHRAFRWLLGADPTYQTLPVLQ